MSLVPERARQQIERLESLLARIQRRVAEPRPLRPVAIADTFSDGPLVPAEPTPPYTPVLIPDTLAHAAVQAEAPVLAAPVLEAPVLEAPVLEAPPVEPEPPVVEAAPISGEVAVAEEEGLLELEELGPASEYDNDPIVEAKLEPEVSAAPAEPIEAHGELEILGEHEPEEDRHDQPPESGRELVASPHESQRVAVAAPALPDEEPLELHDLPQEPEPPVSSRRLASAAPAEPLEALGEVFEAALPPKLQTPVPEAPPAEMDFERTDQFELDRSLHPVEAAPEPHLVEEVGPPSAPVEVDRAPHVIEPPPEPHLVTAESVAHAMDYGDPPTLVRAAVVLPLAPAELPPADVLRPQLPAAEVAAYITAARAPRPETFGLLLDAALEL